MDDGSQVSKLNFAPTLRATNRDKASTPKRTLRSARKTPGTLAFEPVRIVVTNEDHEFHGMKGWKGANGWIKLDGKETKIRLGQNDYKPFNKAF